MTSREPCSSMCLSIYERNYASPPYAQLLSLWVIKTAQDGLLVVGDWFAQLCLSPLIWISQSPYNALAMSAVVVIAQTFLAIYALFRIKNYYDMNAPFLENFFNAVKGAEMKLCTAILGEHAVDVLCKKKGSEEVAVRLERVLRALVSLRRSRALLRGKIDWGY